MNQEKVEVEAILEEIKATTATASKHQAIAMENKKNLDKESAEIDVQSKRAA